MEKKEIKRIVQRKSVVFLNDHKKALQDPDNF